MQGKLIVIDGTDGTGKSTQAARLVDRLREAGHIVGTVKFPRHGDPSAWFVDRYLAGEFGPPSGVPPILASTFYALDRYAAAPDMRQALESGATLVLDRYVTANIGHQASKIYDPTERAAFVSWLEDFEYGTCQLPKPDLNILLHLDVDLARDAQGHQGKLLDLHDTDEDHQRRAERSFLEVASREQWAIVECGDTDGSRRSIDAISDSIWAVVTPLFPSR